MALKVKDKEIAKKMIRHLADGRGVYDACARVGINYMMYNRKFKHDGWFQSELDKAKEAKESKHPLLAATEMIPIGDDPEDDTGLKQRMFIEAMEKNGFRVKQTLKQIGVSKDKYYRAWKNDKRFLLAVEAMREEMLDYYVGLNTEIASDSKHGMAQSNAVIFAIKCLGKDKGWDERTAAPSLNINFNKDAVDAIVRAASMAKLDDVIDAEIVPQLEMNDDSETND